MSNPVPVTIQGLSGSKAGSGGATVLTQAQANQLVQQLRSTQGANHRDGKGAIGGRPNEVKQPRPQYRN